MKKMSKSELEKILLEVIEIYKKLQYTNSHEYFIEPDAITKMFTMNDARKMDEIIRYLELYE